MILIEKYLILIWLIAWILNNSSNLLCISSMILILRILLTHINIATNTDMNTMTIIEHITTIMIADVVSSSSLSYS